MRGAEAMNSRSWCTAVGTTRRISPVRSSTTARVVRAMAQPRRMPRASMRRTTWSSAMATIIAATVRVSASRVWKTNSTSAAVATTAKQTVNAVLSVTWDCTALTLLHPMAAGKDRSPCARCAEALGRSCCQPGPGERLATLTASDVARIQEATGLRRERFVEHEPLSPEEALAYEARRPGLPGVLPADRRALGSPRRAWGLRLPRRARVLARRIEPAHRVPAVSLRARRARLDACRGALRLRGGLRRRSGEPRCLAAEEAREQGRAPPQLRDRRRGLDGADRSLAGGGGGPPEADRCRQAARISLRRREAAERERSARLRRVAAAVECDSRIP